ncbi:hypothetical protein IPJ72_07000 [Candidatus Peregrinibacteria bacterium]|nr:MAG: hypothetical protein IPJ72_07000 [Candidatus Peregrinibacteria bacterium]
MITKTKTIFECFPLFPGHALRHALDQKAGVVESDTATLEFCAQKDRDCYEVIFRSHRGTLYTLLCNSKGDIVTESSIAFDRANDSTGDLGVGAAAA